MKKIITLFSITFLILQSCSNSNNTDQPNENPTFIAGPNLIDTDGNIYHSITNCSQTIMQSNLKVSHYRNGDVIPQVSNNSQWDNLTTGAWRYYNNDPTNGANYGKLYNWYAVTDSRGLAPVGWHIPSNTEWTNLINCLGGFGVAGGKMKSTGTSHWMAPNTGASNVSGFTGLPGGARYTLEPTDVNINKQGGWWSSSPFNVDNSFFMKINFYNSEAETTICGNRAGFSIRCIKNN